MTRLDIKPMSVNKAFRTIMRGRRPTVIKSKEYRQFEHDIGWMLPNNIKIPEGRLTITLRWGLSSKIADWDNPIKPFVDVLQAKYNFNDKRIYKGIVEKVDTPKGKEFIEFEIKAQDTE